MRVRPKTPRDKWDASQKDRVRPQGWTYAEWRALTGRQRKEILCANTQLDGG